MDKSADAFRTISEVAEHLETPAHVLRFWESRFPQIRPVKRAGGRRYYRPSDVSLLTGIKRLLHDEGMTIRGVQKILREQGVRHVAGLSGDAVDDDISFGAAVLDQTADVVVPLVPMPAPFRPAPGLAEAMAKAVDHGPNALLRHAAPSMPVPVAEAAQGALLLTPAPGVAVAADDREAVAQADMDLDIAALVLASQDGGDAPSEPVEQAAFAEAARDADESDDFGDDDFDDGPVVTLASRIRALPTGASAAKVGAELVAVVARLRALRDEMAEAAQAGQA